MQTLKINIRLIVLAQALLFILTFGFLAQSLSVEVSAQGPLSTQQGCEANDGVWSNGSCSFPTPADPGCYIATPNNSGGVSQTTYAETSCSGLGDDIEMGVAINNECYLATSAAADGGGLGPFRRTDCLSFNVGSVTHTTGGGSNPGTNPVSNTGCDDDPNGVNCTGSTAPDPVDEACSSGRTAFCNEQERQVCAEGGNCWQELPIFKDYIAPALDILSIVTIPLITMVIVVGGVQYSAATGDPSKVTAAKKRITNAIIALVSYIFLWAFLQWLIPGGLF